MRTAPWSLLLVLSLAATGCAQCGSDAPGREARAAAEEAEADAPRFVGAKLPVGFPFEILADDVIHASQSLPSGGVQTMDVQIETERPVDEVVRHWEAQLRAAGVAVERKDVERPGFRSVILEGDAAEGLRARVSVLRNDPIDGETRPLKVTIFWGKS